MPSDSTPRNDDSAGPAEGDVYCGVYLKHGACVCSTGYPASCQAEADDA